MTVQVGLYIFSIVLAWSIIGYNLFLALRLRKATVSISKLQERRRASCGACYTVPCICNRMASEADPRLRMRIGMN